MAAGDQFCGKCGRGPIAADFSFCPGCGAAMGTGIATPARDPIPVAVKEEPRKKERRYSMVVALLWTAMMFYVCMQTANSPENKGNDQAVGMAGIASIIFWVGGLGVIAVVGAIFRSIFGKHR
jgi:hypothetical protein